MTRRSACKPSWLLAAFIQEPRLGSCTYWLSLEGNVEATADDWVEKKVAIVAPWQTRARTTADSSAKASMVLPSGAS